MNKILVIDDEKEIVDLVTMHLKREGHEAFTVSNGLDALPMAVKIEPDLIVLDLILPGIDGIEVYKRLCADSRTRHIPVVMLSARSQTHDRIAGLENGADDYVTKPFSPRELMLRINAVLRRTKKVVKLHEETFGPFKLDRKRMTLSVDGKLVDLTVTEFKLLTVLMESCDEPCSRSELLHLVWGHTGDLHSRALDTHIKRLRMKMRDMGAHIVTARGQGYVFQTRVDALPKDKRLTVNRINDHVA
jgi:two-component system phosphate regulon response regulator PhoB